MIWIPGDETSPDRAFLAELYETYSAFLFHRAGGYTSDPYAREDIVQETVLRLIRRVPTLRRLDPPAQVTYLALTLRSAALGYLKGAQPPEEPPEEDPDALQPEDQFLQAERRAGLREALSRLSQRDQTLLLAKYYLGLDNQEIGALLDVGTDSVRPLLARARARAKTELNKEGIDHG